MKSMRLAGQPVGHRFWVSFRRRGRQDCICLSSLLGAVAHQIVAGHVLRSLEPLL